MTFCRVKGQFCRCRYVMCSHVTMFLRCTNLQISIGKADHQAVASNVKEKFGKLSTYTWHRMWRVSGTKNSATRWLHSWSWCVILQYFNVFHCLMDVNFQELNQIIRERKTAWFVPCHRLSAHLCHIDLLTKHVIFDLIISTYLFWSGLIYYFHVDPQHCFFLRMKVTWLCWGAEDLYNCLVGLHIIFHIGPTGGRCAGRAHPLIFAMNLYRSFNLIF